MSIYFQIIYFLTAGLTLALGLLVLLQQPKRPDVRAFAAFMAAVTGWVMSLDLFYVLIDSPGLILIGRLNYAFAELLALFALLFIYYFPKPSIKVPDWLKTILVSSAVALVTLTLTTDLIDEYEAVRGVARVTYLGDLFWLAALFLVAAIVASAALLVIKARRASGAERSEITRFAAAWGVGTVFAVATNVFIPLLTGDQEWFRLGPLAATYFCILFFHSLLRRGFMNVRIMTAEFLVTALVLLFVLEFALSISLVQEVVAAFSLFVGLTLGILLVANYKKSVRRHEQIEHLALDLQTANSQLRELSDAKSEFISIASHQLRTPVSVIKGYLSLMKDGAYGEIGGAVQDKIDQLYEMNERLIHLINNLLNITRIERDNLAYFCQEVDVVETASHAIKELALEARNKGLDLRFRRPAEEKIKVFADPDKLHEIVVNLVDNSLKYTQKGHVEVSLEPDHGDGSVILRVEDTGIGMNPKDLEHLFEKYFRPSQTNSIRESGMSMGLGLFICAKFLHSMGGDIWVERTAPGEGTVFAVRLPTKAVGVCDGPTDDPSKP